MTNLNQIDADLKALKAEVAAMQSTFGQLAFGIGALDDRLTQSLTAINQKLDDLIGGPTDDESQAKVDELTAKLKEQEEKLKAVLTPDVK